MMNTTIENDMQLLKIETKPTDRRLMLDRNEKDLKRMNLDIGQSIVFDKAKTIRSEYCTAAEQELATNLYKIDISNKQIFVNQYHIEFKKVFKKDENIKEYPFLLNSKKTSDYSMFQNRKNLKKLFNALICLKCDFFGCDSSVYLYDYANIFFSLKKLDFGKDSIGNMLTEIHFKLDKEFVADATCLNCDINVVIKDVEKCFLVKEFTDYALLDLKENKNDIISFLELATSNYVSQNSESYVMYESRKINYLNPKEFGFEDKFLSGGKYLSPGALKSVVSIEESTGKKAITAVVVDAKRTPFYQTIPLHDMINFNFSQKLVVYNDDQRKIANSCIKSLECFPVYGNRQFHPITLHRLSSHNADSCIIEYDNKQITVTEYYLLKYEIKLLYPKLPLVETAKRIGKNPIVYPLELLQVADFQRVRNGNLSSKDISTIVKACAGSPSIKSQDIAKCHSSFQFQKDAFLLSSEIKVSTEPMQLTGKILKKPFIIYANNTVESAVQNGKWQIRNGFVNPVTIKSWCVAYLGEYSNDFDLDAFANSFAVTCRTFGISCKKYNDLQYINSIEKLEEYFKYVAEQKCNFLLILEPENVKSYHANIKLLEQKYSVITQCIKSKTVTQRLNKCTMENIVSKTNIKLGGLNYQIRQDQYEIDKDVLFIGLGTNHPTGSIKKGFDNLNFDGEGSDKEELTREFSVLGFAANDGVDPNEFTGNFFFEPMFRDERVKVLDEVLYEILQRFTRNRNCVPKKIVFYRNGCDEGSYSNVLRYEIPIIRATLERYAPNCTITIIIPSKTHSVRILKKNILRNQEQNLFPGTVVDRTIVSNRYLEFYLNSHLAIQGCAKTPRYTVLYSTENEINLEQLECWTYALCYNFQIVKSPISLPAPLYIANRYAERGRQIINASPEYPQYSFNESEIVNVGHRFHYQPSIYYTTSVVHNFTCKPELRGKRINA